MEPETEESEWIGRTVGGYRLVSLLGAGGMGTVFAGEGPDGSAAVKILGGDLPAGAEERFLREARAAAAVAHPHIAKVRQVGRGDGGELFLAMELLKGETLAAALRRGPLGAGHAARIAWQIADAMVAVHAAGTVHRDLKPDNVFLSDGGATAKLLDFGIARVAGSEATETGTMMGTPDYVAPEQARSARRADARADVYAFGVMLFEMTTGRLPFAGATVYEVLRRHVECAPPLPSRHAPIPAELERLILRCLEKDPALRPSMPELRRLLRPHWQDAPAAPPVEEVTAVSTSRHARGLAVTVASSRRRRRARLLLGALLVAWLTAALIGSILAAG